jgi:hypothetical protein
MGCIKVGRSLTHTQVKRRRRVGFLLKAEHKTAGRQTRGKELRRADGYDEESAERRERGVTPYAARFRLLMDSQPQPTAGG